MKDTFEFLKREQDISLIGEIKVLDKEPFLIYDKLNLFDKPFFSDNDNGWLRINLPYNQSAENIKIKRIKTVFFADTIVLSTDFLPVRFDNTWSYWTHSFIRDLGDKFKVKIYG